MAGKGPGRGHGRRPGKVRVAEALKGLRINQGITSAMLPGLSFEPTLGITARRIDKLGIDIRSFHEPLKRAIQQVAAPSFQRNFDTGGRPDRWDPLSEGTIEVQKNLGGSHTDVMIKSGLLRRTMGQVNIWTITKESAILRDLPESVWYGKVHQKGLEGEGGKASKGAYEKRRAAVNKALRGGGSVKAKYVPTIPARPFVLLQPDDVEAIEKVFDTWLGERIDRVWPKHG